MEIAPVSIPNKYENGQQRRDQSLVKGLIDEVFQGWFLYCDQHRSAASVSVESQSSNAVVPQVFDAQIHY